MSKAHTFGLSKAASQPPAVPKPSTRYLEQRTASFAREKQAKPSSAPGGEKQVQRAVSFARGLRASQITPPAGPPRTQSFARKGHAQRNSSFARDKQVSRTISFDHKVFREGVHSTSSETCELSAGIGHASIHATPPDVPKPSQGYLIRRASSFARDQQLTRRAVPSSCSSDGTF